MTTRRVALITLLLALWPQLAMAKPTLRRHELSLGATSLHVVKAADRPQLGVAANYIYRRGGTARFFLNLHFRGAPGAEVVPAYGYAELAGTLGLEVAKIKGQGAIGFRTGIGAHVGFVADEGNAGPAAVIALFARYRMVSLTFRFEGGYTSAQDGAFFALSPMVGFAL